VKVGKVSQHPCLGFLIDVDAPLASFAPAARNSRHSESNDFVLGQQFDLATFEPLPNNPGLP
jgi:hypothetical protein